MCPKIKLHIKGEDKEIEVKSNKMLYKEFKQFIITSLNYSPFSEVIFSSGKFHHNLEIINLEDQKEFDIEIKEKWLENYTPADLLQQYNEIYKPKKPKTRFFFELPTKYHNTPLASIPPLEFFNYICFGSEETQINEKEETVNSKQFEFNKKLLENDSMSDNIFGRATKASGEEVEITYLVTGGNQKENKIKMKYAMQGKEIYKLINSKEKCQIQTIYMKMGGKLTKIENSNDKFYFLAQYNPNSNEETAKLIVTTIIQKVTKINVDLVITEPPQTYQSVQTKVQETLSQPYGPHLDITLYDEHYAQKSPNDPISPKTKKVTAYVTQSDPGLIEDKMSAPPPPPTASVTSGYITQHQRKDPPVPTSEIDSLVNLLMTNLEKNPRSITTYIFSPQYLEPAVGELAKKNADLYYQLKLKMAEQMADFMTLDQLNEYMNEKNIPEEVQRIVKGKTQILDQIKYILKYEQNQE